MISITMLKSKTTVVGSFLCRPLLITSWPVAVIIVTILVNAHHHHWHHQNYHGDDDDVHGDEDDDYEDDDDVVGSNADGWSKHFP